jgi:hypothetical protein
VPDRLQLRPHALLELRAARRQRELEGRALAGEVLRQLPPRRSERAIVTACRARVRRGMARVSIGEQVEPVEQAVGARVV